MAGGCFQRKVTCANFKNGVDWSILVLYTKNKSRIDFEKISRTKCLTNMKYIKGLDLNFVLLNKYHTVKHVVASEHCFIKFDC